jgi:hypothetical protein
MQVRRSLYRLPQLAQGHRAADTVQQKRPHQHRTPQQIQLTPNRQQQAANYSSSRAALLSRQLLTAACMPFPPRQQTRPIQAREGPRLPVLMCHMRQTRPCSHRAAMAAAVRTWPPSLQVCRKIPAYPPVQERCTGFT